MLWIIIIIVILFCLFLYFKHRKKLKLGQVIFISGDVKTGKSTLSIKLANKKYKWELFKWKFFKFLHKIIFKEYKKDMPLFISNIPTRIKNHVNLTNDMLTLKVAIPDKSVMYIGEFSLVADSQLIKNKELNEQLLLFMKLAVGHGFNGTLIIDSQNITDLHYSVKRVCSKYLWIRHTIKLPFFLLMQVSELYHSEDGNTININDSDLDDTNVRWLIVSKHNWKIFNYRCYHDLIYKDKPKITTNDVIQFDKKDKLMARDIPTFKPWLTLNLEKSEEYKENEQINEMDTQTK